MQVRFINYVIIFTLPVTLFIQPEKSKRTNPRYNAVSKNYQFSLGQDLVNVKVSRYGENRDLVFVNLHDNESTSVLGTQSLLETYGGVLIKIENRGKRNISFRLRGRRFTFDPNRIFSMEGIRQTLNELGASHHLAMEEINRFADRFLQLFPEQPYCVIALHNNTDGAFSIDDYLPGNSKETDARLVEKCAEEDPDDFFLTTDSLLFYRLSAGQYNTIWQHNENAKRDGSLSVYFGEKNTRYLNCETEHGKVSKYNEMMEKAIQILEESRRNDAEPGTLDTDPGARPGETALAFRNDLSKIHHSR